MTKNTKKHQKMTKNSGYYELNPIFDPFLPRWPSLIQGGVSKRGGSKKGQNTAGNEPNSKGCSIAENTKNAKNTPNPKRDFF